MKTSILALAIALAFSFTPTPAAAKVSAKQKCDAGKQTATAKHLQCRTLAEAKNTKKPDATKRSAALAKCDTKLEDMFAKFEGKAPEDAMAADEDQCSYYGDLDNVKALNTTVSDAVADGTCSEAECTAADNTSDNAAIAATAAQAACDDANGSWDGSVCTPGAVPDRDCFREGVCGEDGFNDGDYEGETVHSTGCNDTAAGAESYWDGHAFYEIITSGQCGAAILAGGLCG